MPPTPSRARFRDKGNSVPDLSIDRLREAEFEAMLRNYVLEECADLRCEIFLFGSRARGAIRRSSDFDIGIRGLSPEQFRRVSRRVEDWVEESRIPHRVDLVDFDRAEASFQAIATKETQIWKSA